MIGNSTTVQGANGLLLAADISGDAGAMPVLLAHGGGQTRYAWKGVTDDLVEAGFRAIAVDMRGHGDSQWAEDGAYEFRDFASDLIAIASRLEQKPAVIGASLGGLAGIMAEGDLAKGSFASLTLVDVAPRMEPSGVARVVGFMAEHIETGFASAEEAAEIIANYLPHRRNRGASEGLTRYLRKRDNGRFYWHWDPAFIRDRAHSGSDDSSRQQEQFDGLSKAAANLALPLHLVRGKASDLVSRASVEHLRELAPPAVYTDIDDATHMVVGDSNAVFSAAIRDFLRRHHNCREERR